MSELQYRFKSPDQLRAEQAERQGGKKKRNRIALLVLLDIGILAIVMAIVYYSGVLDDPALLDPAALEQADRRLEASHKIGDGTCIFYLHITNTKASAQIFPLAEDQPLRVGIVDQAGTNLYTRIEAPQEELPAGQTRIVRSELPCPATRLPLQEARISLGKPEAANPVQLIFKAPQ